MMLPLNVTAALQPHQWRGGQLMALWKNKGSASCIRNYRDITLTEQNSKVAGRSVRKLLIEGVAATAVATQMGSGFNGGATDVGHL